MRTRGALTVISIGLIGAALAAQVAPAAAQCAPEVIDRMQDADGLPPEALIVGQHLYLPEGGGLRSGLLVFDVSGGGVPRPVGRVAAPTLCIASSGQLLIAGGHSQMHAFDIAVPTAPREVGSLPLPGYVRSAALRNDGAVACVTVDDAGLFVVDTENPASPHVVGSLEMAGRARRIAMDGDVVYIADRAEGLRIIDVSDPAAPKEIAAVGTGGDAWSVAIEGGVCWVGHRDIGPAILDVTDPAGPIVLARLAAPTRVTAILPEPSLVWMLGGGTSGLEAGLELLAFDARDLADPIIVARTPLVEPLWALNLNQALAIHGATAYVGESYFVHTFYYHVTTVDIACAMCPADCDASGELDFFDFLCFQNLFAAGDPRADCDGSGAFDLFDFLCFQNAFAAGCP